MKSNIIYHVVTNDSWLSQINSKEYRHASLASEGFIHASNKDQIEGVLNRYYQGVKDLLLLSIDTRLVDKSVEIKEEMAESIGELFPHIYGSVNKTAVIDIKRIR